MLVAYTVSCCGHSLVNQPLHSIDDAPVSGMIRVGVSSALGRSLALSTQPIRHPLAKFGRKRLAFLKQIHGDPIHRIPCHHDRFGGPNQILEIGRSGFRGPNLIESVRSSRMVKYLTVQFAGG